jgi:signal peptidase I
MGEPEHRRASNQQDPPAEEPAATASSARRAGAAVVRLFTLALLMVLVFAALALILVPRFTGSQTYTVLTNSMAPKNPPGTFLAVKPAAFNDPNPVRELQVSGKLFYAVPYVGYVASALGNSDRSLWATIGAAALIGYGALLIVRTLRSRKPGPENNGKESA